MAGMSAAFIAVAEETPSPVNGLNRSNSKAISFAGSCTIIGAALAQVVD
jgi:hypothetical protein